MTYNGYIKYILCLRIIKNKTLSSNGRQSNADTKGVVRHHVTDHHNTNQC